MTWLWIPHASSWSSTYECVGLLRTFHPLLTSRFTFQHLPAFVFCLFCVVVWFCCFGVFLFPVFALLCFWFLFCKCLGIPNSPRSLDLDDRQGLIARSAMQQKKKINLDKGFRFCSYWPILFQSPGLEETQAQNLQLIRNLVTANGLEMYELPKDDLLENTKSSPQDFKLRSIFISFSLTWFLFLLLLLLLLLYVRSWTQPAPPDLEDAIPISTLRRPQSLDIA